MKKPTQTLAHINIGLNHCMVSFFFHMLGASFLIKLFSQAMSPLVAFFLIFSLLLCNGLIFLLWHHLTYKSHPDANYLPNSLYLSLLDYQLYLKIIAEIRLCLKISAYTIIISAGLAIFAMILSPLRWLLFPAGLMLGLMLVYLFMMYLYLPKLLALFLHLNFISPLPTNIDITLKKELEKQRQFYELQSDEHLRNPEPKPVTTTPASQTKIIIETKKLEPSITQKVIETPKQLNPYDIFITTLENYLSVIAITHIRPLNQIIDIFKYLKKKSANLNDLDTDEQKIISITKYHFDELIQDIQTYLRYPLKN